MGRSGLGVFVAVVMSATLCSAASAAVVATEHAPTPIAAARGTAVWSGQDNPSPLAEYQLRLYANGIVRTLPVPSSPVPFDANIGSDAKRRTVVVYSRCKVERPNRVDAQGCSLFEYQLGSRRERRLPMRVPNGSSNFAPVIDGDYVAFASVPDGSAQPMPRIYLVNTRTDRRRQIAAGPRGSYQLRSDGYYDGPTPTALDLNGRRVGLIWRYFDPACTDSEGDIVPSSEVLVATERGAAHAIASAACEQRETFGGLALTPSSILYLHRDGTDRVLTSYRFSDRRVSTALGYASSFAIGGSASELFDVREQASGYAWVVTRSRPALQASG